MPVLHEAPAPGLLRFGVFELNTRSGELHKHGVKIPLRDQSVRILAMLLSCPGEMVTREEIKRSLWPAGTFVEFDHSINTAVTRLRQALGDPAENSRFIETVAGRGYRFIAPLGPVHNAEPGRNDERQWSPAGRVTLALAAIAIVAGGLAVWLRLEGAARGTSIESGRVAVAVFENRTGDPSLDLLGRIAADWISEGLSRIGTVAVAPAATVLELAAANAQPARDPVRALARATGASLVVSGAYYKNEYTLRIHATITDVPAGKLLPAVEPASSEIDQPMEALETVRRHVVNAVAARYLSREFDFLSHEPKPPGFEAYRELLTGLEVFYTDNAAAIPHLTRALELDPEFTAPRTWLFGAYYNLAKFADAAKQVEVLEGRRGQLSPIERRRLDFFASSLAGRYEEALTAQRDVVKLAPDSSVERFRQGGWALASNHLKEAAEALRAPVRWDFMVKPGAPFGSVRFLELTTALHELGAHRQELAEARRGRAVYPNLMNVRSFEARALVALGRLDDLGKLVSESLAMPPSWGGCTAGTVMTDAAIELRAHGYRDASIAMAGRAEKWFRGRPVEGECALFVSGVALYYQESWERALEIFALLSSGYPSNVSYRGTLGTLAAHRGDRDSLNRIAGDLQRIERPYMFGEPAYQRARIASVLGDREGAVGLLRQAIAGGFTQDPRGYRFLLHHEMDLETLRGYPSFEELLRPRE